jgi:hypothetical protein
MNTALESIPLNKLAASPPLCNPASAAAVPGVTAEYRLPMRDPGVFHTRRHVDVSLILLVTPFAGSGSFPIAKGSEKELGSWEPSRQAVFH